MKSAFIFPGQASQYVGMGQDLYEHSETGRRYFDQANEILGVDIARLSFSGPEEELKQTRHTQPAIYIVSVILGKLLLDKGTNPAAVAGHSLGEYSALAIAGAFDFATGLEMVKIRATSMQQAGVDQPGTMAAILGMADEQVEAICNLLGAEALVVPANYNAPGQLVISGSVDGVRQAMALAKEQGALKAVELNVSGAFHSPLMSPAKTALAEKIEATDIRDLSIPVYANVTASPVTGGDEIKKALLDQLENPVRWYESINNMAGAGIAQFTEVGPGRVLRGLLRRINRKLSVNGVESITDIQDYANE